MPLTDTYQRVPCTQIQVPRDQRQRKEVKTEGLLESIRRFGVLQPLLVDRNYVLIAGETRLAASIQLGLPDVPVRFLDDLTPVESQIIELTENVQRSDLPWRDEVVAVARIHKLYQDTSPSWSLGETAAAVCLSAGIVSIYIRVATEIDDARIKNATSYREAYNILSRRDERAVADALNEIMETTSSVSQAKPNGQDLDPTADATVIPLAGQIHPPEKSILQEDFLRWAPQYKGPKFSFLHCDFPYGINFNSGPQSGSNRHSQMYEDRPDIYWTLLGCLCKNLDHLMAPSGHLMFWFSEKNGPRTREVFRKLAPELVFWDFPLIWLKSDNAGILADPRRGPRHIYETALIASREDRLIIKATSDAYQAPTDKQWHPSTKPEPMLRYFFSMFVDEGTKMLDPTCGSGSSLRAAESLGAKYVLGLETEPEHCQSARTALKQFRLLRKVAR